MQTALATLRDIDGVVGSFVIDGEGRVLGRDLPTLFDDDTLGYASQRLVRLRNALEGERCKLDGSVARFGSHLMMMKAVDERTLCVIVPHGTNLMALQMGANIVARRVAQMTPQLHDSAALAVTVAGTVASPIHAEPAAPAPPAPATPSPAAATPSAAPTRMFRGRRIA
jgi:predicted regulator of Ras-like GTPase activity (Roadblock/LC7/MglB family)